MFSLIQIVSGINLNTSDCNRKLIGVGKYARIFTADHSTIISKITVVATIIGTVVIGVVPYVIGKLAVQVIMTSSLHVLVAIASVAAIALALLMTTVCQCAVIQEVSREYSIQQQEKQIVDALGGKDMYDSLPHLSDADIKQLNLMGSDDDDAWEPNYIGDLDSIKPDHVHYNQITVGVDPINRPFVAVHVKEKTTGNTFIDTLFLRDNPAVPFYWIRSGDDGQVFVDKSGRHSPKNDFNGHFFAKLKKEFNCNIETLEKLKAGTHPTHELAQVQ